MSVAPGPRTAPDTMLRDLSVKRLTRTESSSRFNKQNSARQASGSNHRQPPTTSMSCIYRLASR
jgi:hypothetical protein